MQTNIRNRIELSYSMRFVSIIRIIAKYFNTIPAKYQFVLGSDELVISNFRYRNVG